MRDREPVGRAFGETEDEILLLAGGGRDPHLVGLDLDQLRVIAVGGVDVLELIDEFAVGDAALVALQLAPIRLAPERAQVGREFVGQDFVDRG